MSLFKRKKPVVGTYFGEPLYNDEPANYDSAVAYLEGLSIEDYAKVLKVAGICRQANEDCAAALGVPLEPTTFINPPEPAEPSDEPEFLTGDEKSKPKKIAVK